MTACAGIVKLDKIDKIEALVEIALALTAPASAFFDGGDGKWVSGSVLIKFDTDNRHQIQLFADRLGAFANVVCR